jgi:hypothetical protein
MLELTKCFYYVLSWQFDEEGFATPIMKSDQRKTSDQIRIFNSTTKATVSIVQKEVSESHKTLGCYKTIDGNEQDQVKYLKKKSDKYGARVPSAKLNRKQALMTYKMIYIP